jgi:hypothetical protein
VYVSSAYHGRGFGCAKMNKVLFLFLKEFFSGPVMGRNEVGEVGDGVLVVLTLNSGSFGC